MTAFLARLERLDAVESTNDVVRDWLGDGVPEVCVAVAGEQTAGRGRDGRSWVAPPGAALLLSLGFRPTWLAPEQVWRLAAVASLALADASERVAGLAAGTIALKWPNDLVIAATDPPGTPVGADGSLRKVAGVLGETDGLGTPDPRAVVGLGINVDWAAADFPDSLAGSMWSLREAAGGRPIDRDLLFESFIGEREPRVEALRRGEFDEEAWVGRQVTTGRTIRLITPFADELVDAVGVDPASGALLIADRRVRDAVRHVLVGEIVHVRLADPVTERV
jgi:BirA family transcriptional regulator, biotin operon repressor / biotin---[acetyl-CoA-carboxylase] ligase